MISRTDPVIRYIYNKPATAHLHCAAEPTAICHLYHTAVRRVFSRVFFGEIFAGVA